MARATDGTGQAGHTAPRHVWVRVGDAAAPGVLIDWRRDPDGWMAHVLYAVVDQEDGTTATRQEWRAADEVRPID